MFTVRIKSFEPNEPADYYVFHGRLTSRKYKIILREMYEMVSRFSRYVVVDIYPQMGLREVAKMSSWEEGRHCIEMGNVIGSPTEMYLSADSAYIKNFFV